MEVLRLMKANYKVDESRIYLIGHSMGAIGTWALGVEVSGHLGGAGAVFRRRLTRARRAMKGIPQFVVHGDNDPTVNVSGSRTMVAALKKLGADVTYVEVAGGNHTDVVVPNLPNGVRFPRRAEEEGDCRHEQAVT